MNMFDKFVKWYLDIANEGFARLGNCLVKWTHAVLSIMVDMIAFPLKLVRFMDSRSAWKLLAIPIMLMTFPLWVIGMMLKLFPAGEDDNN
jgi:hypothetical protein